MAKKITYLLGAGASATAIPVVAQMSKRIEEIVKMLAIYINPHYYDQPNPERFLSLPENLKIESNPTLVNVISDLNWLLNEAENHFSIDTLARKYYLTEDEENYERLKKCLLFYFTLEQFIFFKSTPDNENYFFNKNPIDKRYDSFISAIAAKSNGNITLNSNIKILSWNYDLQFELSLKRFKEIKEIQLIKQIYQIFPLLYIPYKDYKLQVDNKRFSLLKLNGNAIYSCTQSSPYDYPTIFDNKFNEKNSVDKSLSLLLNEWAKFNFKINSACRYFNFAWEGNLDFSGRKHEDHSNIIKEAELIASETEILVVIGYSFPIFNREIDNKLFKKMEKLEKVYIQDKEPEKIKSTMQNAFKKLQEMIIVDKFHHPVTNASGDPNNYTKASKVSFQLESNTNQFVIPYELNQD